MSNEINKEKMEDDKKQEIEKKSAAELRTFTVPITLGKNRKNISIPTDTESELSQEQIINQAFKFHSQGNIPCE